LDRAHWRRENVNKLVRRLQGEIGKQKAWVTFGISPFGIWRPKNPPQIRGFDAYEGLYADARLWLANGWVDYMAPQLYWSIDEPEQSYPVLLNWWQQQSAKGRPVWPGGAITRAQKWGPEEILRQIEFTRELPQPGYIHWNLSSLVRNTKLQAGLKARTYVKPALVPVNPGDAGPVSKPAVIHEKRGGDQHLLRWSVPAGQMISCWVLQIKRGAEWEIRVLPASTKAELVHGKNVTAVAVTAVSRFRNASPATVISLQ
jgi:hypothetical protein